MKILDTIPDSNHMLLLPLIQGVVCHHAIPSMIRAMAAETEPIFINNLADFSKQIPTFIRQDLQVITAHNLHSISDQALIPSIIFILYWSFISLLHILLWDYFFLPKLFYIFSWVFSRPFTSLSGTWSPASLFFLEPRTSSFPFMWCCFKAKFCLQVIQCLQT